MKTNDEEMRNHNKEDYDADDEIPNKNEGYNNDESFNKAEARRNP